MRPNVRLLAAILLTLAACSPEKPYLPPTVVAEPAAPTSAQGVKDIRHTEAAENAPAVDAHYPWSEPFVFVEGCFESRAPSEHAARRRCRSLRNCKHERSRSGRKSCDLNVVHVTPEDPVSYWTGCHWSHAKSAEEAAAACLRSIRDIDFGPDISDWGHPQEWVLAVTGPYPRKVDMGGYDDPERYRYLTSDGLWVDEVYEPPCFPAGTAIATPEGVRAIETIRPGETVLAYDAEQKRERPVQVRVVKQRLANTILVLRAGDRELRVTANHPIYSADREAFVAAGELQIGEALLLRERGSVDRRMITSIRSQAGAVEVFDLSLGPPHTHFAGGFFVHNY